MASLRSRGQASLPARRVRLWHHAAAPGGGGPGQWRAGGDPGRGRPPEGHVIAMSAVYLANSPLGPAGGWFIDRLKDEAAPRGNGNASQSADSLHVLPITNPSPNRIRLPTAKAGGPNAPHPHNKYHPPGA